MCPFDLNGRHRACTDASQFAVEVVLLQHNEDDWQPVECASRKFSEAEQRYAMVKKEASAMT